MSTHRGDDQVEHDIRPDVESVVAAIRGSGVEFDAVYLLSSTGRGEGTVSFHGSGWTGINDYDLVVICPEGATALPSLRHLGRKLGESLSTDFVDIGCLRRSSLSKLAPTLEQFALKHSSLLVAGQDLSAEMPDFKPEDIPPYEFARLLCNRTAGLLTARVPEHSASSHYRDNQYIKACVAIGDVAVYLGHGYHALYRERLHFFQSLAECGRTAFPLSQAESEWIVRAYLRKLDDPSSLPFVVDEVQMQGMIGRAYCAIARCCTGRQIRTVRGAERALARRYRTACGLWERLDDAVRTWRKRQKNRGADTAQRILFSLPVFYCRLLAPSWLSRAAYCRRFWFVPGALAGERDALSLVRLWEEYCH